MSKYIAENSFTFLLPSIQLKLATGYLIANPVSKFEKSVSDGLSQASAHLSHEEYGLALSAYTELAALILHTANPKLPINVGAITGFNPPFVAELLDPIIDVAARTLTATSPLQSAIPAQVLPQPGKEPAAVLNANKAYVSAGVAPSKAPAFAATIESAERAVKAGQWDAAKKLYAEAIKQVPKEDARLLEDLQEDLELVRFESGELKERTTPVRPLPVQPLPVQPSPLRPLRSVRATAAASAPAAELAVAVSLRPDELPLKAGARLAAREQAAELVIVGMKESATIALGDSASTSLKQFYDKRAKTADLGLIWGHWDAPVTTVAYLPYVYFFVIPMALGDCHLGLGDFARAEQSYKSALVYPYLNASTDLFRIFTRLAELYLEWGDHLYRRGGNVPAQWQPAKQKYERIIRSNGTLDNASPLYQDARFASLRGRVTAIIAAANPLTLDENPQLVSLVLRARQALSQIGAGLNFFTFAPDYLPPFTFEYLQNTARYLAQQAGRMAQLYVNFKSRAETEQLSRDQLDQQADVARATVDLEQLGVAEAEAGMRMAEASLNYANVQVTNSQQARDSFDAVRWELLELAQAEAWSQAAAVDEDDEVRQTWNGHYYSSSDRNRSDVLLDLAFQRTLISHDMEAARLQREVASAEAYRGIAQAQVAQAQSRIATAHQRVAIAELQQRYAEQNRDFLDDKEFSARAWYELARASRTLVRRYIDSATSAAFLMERAYFLETGRDLKRIRFDWASTTSQGLLAGEMLSADIDSFTQDYLTTTRSRKAPVKQSMSLADKYPMAFAELQRTGRCVFETTFDQFNRDYPGAYLAKIRNVEIIFVGISNATGIKGTLRNIGVSKYRELSGAIMNLLSPPDVLPLSQYEPRQDALLFRFNPNELRVFENCGIATRWQLDLPLDANDFDFRQILDIHLVLYYDAFHDASLEVTTRAALPAGGNAARSIPLSLYWPDELFYLRNQGSAQLAFTANLFPHNHSSLKRSRILFKLLGETAVVSGLKVRLLSREAGTNTLLTAGADGLIDSATSGSPLAALLGRTVIDDWEIRIDPADNPGLFPSGSGPRPPLTGLTDVQIFLEYAFTYRTAA